MELEYNMNEPLSASTPVLVHIFDALIISKNLLGFHLFNIQHQTLLKHNF